MKRGGTVAGLRGGASVRRAVTWLAFAWLVSAGMLGCSSIPKGASAVDAVDIEGSDAVSDSDVEDAIATVPSPKFLFLFQGVVYDYEIFDRFVLQQDLKRVERFYRARGYYEAHARAARIQKVPTEPEPRKHGLSLFEPKDDKPKEDHVRVTIVVDEGPAVRVAGVHVAGLEGIDQAAAIAAQAAAHGKLLSGALFDEQVFNDTETAFKRALTDKGYAYAQTSKRAEVDLPKHEATIYYEAFPGPPSTLGEITLEGLGGIPEAPVRRALKLRPGQEYSTQAIDDAQQAVLDLGAFSTVTITPTLPEPPAANAVVPLHVKLELTKQHQVTLGGGLEFDSIKTDLHLLGRWEDHNFLGGFRNFRVQFRPGVVLYPLRFATPFLGPRNPLPEERFQVELRQPGFLEGRTNGVIQSEVNTYPWIFTPQDAERTSRSPVSTFANGAQAAQSVPPPDPVLGYFEYKGRVGVDRTWWKLYGFPSYNFQTNTPFAYLGSLAPELSTIVISSLELLTQFDLRDDRIHPHRGFFFLNDFQFAGLGGDAHDVRIQPDARVYIGVTKKITLALRGTVGLLFPFNYGRTLNDPTFDPTTREGVKDTQLVFLRGFFSGGPSSNRGYPLRGVGPHGQVSFLSPSTVAQTLARSCGTGAPGSDTAPPTNEDCQLPLGGLTLIEASTELRIPINGPLSGSLFCDASNVSRYTADPGVHSVRDLHVACGPGIRYDTPVGPIRLDIGARIPGLNPTRSEDPTVPEGLFGIDGLPLAFAFGIGEAF